MDCWKCRSHLQMPLGQKLSFRETCPKCEADLHCCFNCTYYKPGRPNDCLVPNTEFISDRQKNNLCEDFRLKKEETVNASLPPEVLKKVFGESPPPKKNSKDKFQDLFKSN